MTSATQENPETPADASTPYVMGPNGAFSGVIRGNDVDWVRFEVSEGSAYRFTMEGYQRDWDSFFIETQLELVRADGTVIDSHWGVIDYVATETETLYLAASGTTGHFDGVFSDGPYGLTAAT